MENFIKTTFQTPLGPERMGINVDHIISYRYDPGSDGYEPVLNIRLSDGSHQGFQGKEAEEMFSQLEPSKKVKAKGISYS